MRVGFLGGASGVGKKLEGRIWEMIPRSDFGIFEISSCGGEILRELLIRLSEVSAFADNQLTSHFQVSDGCRESSIEFRGEINRMVEIR
jgi:hypothetical protein